MVIVLSSSSDGHAANIEGAKVGLKISNEVTILGLVSTHAAGNVIQFGVAWRLGRMVAAEAGPLHRAVSPRLRAVRSQAS